MELPQLEQALLLAEMARERSELSAVKATGDTKCGAQDAPTGVLGPETMGLLPLALAWEGSALALLAARGEPYISVFGNEHVTWLDMLRL